MNNNCLFTLQGSLVIGVEPETANKLTVKNLVRAKKAQAGIIEAPRYDMNGDGVIDDIDISIIKKELFSSK